MKIPVQSPLQHVANHLQHAQHIIHQTLINFGKNVITNRDIKNKAATLKVSQVREIAVVPYESSPRVVDADSFAYALSSAITESQDQHDSKKSLLKSMKLFFYHPIRVLAATIIIILAAYIGFMAHQINSNTQQHIDAPVHSSKTINH